MSCHLPEASTAACVQPAAEIRQAVPADFDAVAAIAISRAGGDRARWSQHLRGDLADPERGLWVAELGEIVGYGRVHRFRASADAPPGVAPDGYYLIGLGVSPQHQRHGIGRAITRARLSWIARRASMAWYFTNARNEASLRLHRELGFREVTRDFSYPGVTFEGGVGILSSVQFSPGP